MATRIVRGTGTSRTIGLVIFFVLAAVAVPIETATAGGPLQPPQSPSVLQYLESLPTSGGSVATGTKGARTLPASLTRKIDRLGGGDAPVLKSIAEAAAYGAPQQPLRHKPHDTRAKPLGPSAAVSLAGVSAAVGTFTGAGSHTFSFLLAVTTAVALAGLLVVVARMRGQRQ